MITIRPDLTLYRPEFRLSINGSTVPCTEHPLHITSVSVTERLDQAGVLVIQISVPEDCGVDTELLYAGSRVVLDLGYTNNLVNFINGSIKNISTNYPSSGIPQMTIEVFDKTHNLQDNKPGALTASSAEGTIGDIVRMIAQESDLKAEVDDTQGAFENYTIPPNKTYLDHVRYLAKKVNYRFFLRGDTLHFRKPIFDAEPVRTLVWRESLISFNPTLNTTGQVTKVRVTGRRSGTGEDIVGEADASTLQMGGGGMKSGSDLQGERSERVLHLHRPVENQEEADEMAKAKLTEINEKVMTGNGSCVGDPNIRPGEVLEIGNLAAMFNGRYLVTSATHGIAGGGYTTRFYVRRGVVGE